MNDAYFPVVIVAAGFLIYSF